MVYYPRMIDPFVSITSFLAAHQIVYTLLEHEPVYTSEQAASVRGVSLTQGAKSLLLQCDSSFILAVLPGDRKLDTKKMKKLLHKKDIHFADPGDVLTIMGCEIGACYPFGNLIDVPMYVDPLLSRNETISFNPGVHTKSLIMQWKEYVSVVKPVLVDISK